MKRNALSLLRVEFFRLLHTKSAWVAVGVTILSAGIGILQQIGTSDSISLNSQFLANPALFSALVGAVVFGVLTAGELNRKAKYNTFAITDSIIQPSTLYLSQTLSLILLATLSQAASLLLWLPVCAIGVGSVFSFGLYLNVYLSVSFAAIIFSILFTAAMYTFTGRFDLSIILMAVFLLISMIVVFDNWLLRWVNPPLCYLSDDFSNNRTMISVLYNRLFWLLILVGIWVLSFLFVRKYSKNFAGSLVINIKKAYHLPIVAFVLCASGVLSYIHQPFMDHSPLTYDEVYWFETDDELTCSAINVDLRPQTGTGKLLGTAEFVIKNTRDSVRTAEFVVNPGYKISSVTTKNITLEFRDLGNEVNKEKTIEVDIPAKFNSSVVIEYGGFPQEWSILSLNQGQVEISDTYMYLVNQDFAPMPDNFNNFGDYTTQVLLPEGMTPVLFGYGTAEEVGKQGNLVEWKLLTRNSVMHLYAGDYMSKSIKSGDIDIEFYYSKKHQRIMDECNVDDVIKEVFDYCTDKIGRLNYLKDNKLKLISIRSIGGGYAGGGSSVMSEDSFNEKGLKDPQKGASGSEVLAHEIIHQWWGLGNMFGYDETEGWSSEGLTVYTTYRLMKQKYGDEYAKKYYIDVWEDAVADYYDNFYVRNPQYLDLLSENQRNSVLFNFSGMKRYSEMPLKILKAEKLVGGEEEFDKIIYGLFNREIDYTDPYLSYDTFLSACNLTREDLTLE